MPTYEYRCESCAHEFEQFQSITAAALRKCPDCGKNRLQRLIGTGAGIIFKGSGFYETDYRSESYKKDAKADKESKSEGKKDSSKSEASTTTDSAKKESSKKANSSSKASSSKDSGGSKKKE